VRIRTSRAATVFARSGEAAQPRHARIHKRAAGACCALRPQQDVHKEAALALRRGAGTRRRCAALSQWCLQRAARLSRQSGTAACLPSQLVSACFHERYVQRSV